MATGLNFHTQTIINSNYDPDSKAVLWTTDGSGDDAHVKIKRDFDFFKNNEKGKVLSIYNRKGSEPTMCEVSIDVTDFVSTSGKKYYRLDVYVSVEGAEPFILANQWVQKGRPFWIELVASEKDSDAEALAAKWAKEINKSRMFQIDKDLITATVEGSVITLKGNQEFLRLKTVILNEYNSDSEYADKVAEIGDEAITLENRGTNGFGTYSQIVKDLRLPTAANTNWTHIRQAETPVIGGVYDQFIVKYCAPAVNDGMQAVGQKLDSVTTHVFWVKNDVAAEFKAALATVGTVTPAVDGEGTEDATSTVESNPLTD